jgi:hypothetical protein
VSAEQLQRFAVPNGNGHRPMTKGEAGLAKEIGPGPERLLAELTKRGLRRDHLRVAAALVLALEDEATR